MRRRDDLPIVSDDPRITPFPRSDEDRHAIDPSLVGTRIVTKLGDGVPVTDETLV